MVEDDPALLSLAAYVFGKEGHHVLTNVDAFGALALLLSHSVDLLFTDIDLAQGTSGVTLARDARALRSDLPVAYTSGRIDLSPDQMVPGSVFLPKPYRLQEVIGLPGRLAKAVIEAPPPLLPGGSTTATSMPKGPSRRTASKRLV